MAEVLSMIGHVKDTPRVLRRAFQERQQYGKEFIDIFAARDIKKIFFLGSGTSHHAMLAVRNMFVSILGVEGVACEPTIFAHHEPINPSGIFAPEQIAVIGLSQHGTSISTCTALQRARDEGYLTYAVTEELGSPITTVADHTIHIVCEREEIGPETRGYTETLFQFYLMAMEIALKKGIMPEADYRRMNNDAEELINNLPTVINESIAWFEKNKAEFLTMGKSSIAGYGENFVTALEARLKFFETFSRPCTGYEMEEQMHGPLRAYSDKNFMFLIGSGGPELERMKELVAYYRRVFTEHVFVVSSEEFEATEKDLAFSFRTTDILSPCLYVIPFQVLSALLCEEVGIDTRVSPIKDRSVSSHMKRS